MAIGNQNRDSVTPALRNNEKREKCLCINLIVQYNPNIKIKNYILLCAKYFIFLNKCHTTIPSCNCFKKYLYKQIDIEKIIAQQRDKLESHNFKWRVFF